MAGKPNIKKYKLIIKLRDEDKMTFQAIAKKLGLKSRSTVVETYYDAKKLLNKVIHSRELLGR